MLTAPRYLRRQIKRRWPSYAIGLTMMVMTALTEVLVPKFVQWVLDDLVAFQKTGVADTGRFHLLIGGLITCAVLGMIGRWGWRQFLARQTHIAGYNLKNRIWNTLRYQPLHTFHQFPLGDLMNRSTADWNKSRFIHGFTMVLTLDMVLLTILGIGFMLYVNLELALLSLMIVPFLPPFVIRISKKEYELHGKAQDKLSDLTSLISQVIMTVRVLRSTGSEERWREKLNEKASTYADAQFKTIKTGWQIFPFGVLPTIFAYGILLSYGIHKIREGSLTIGEFVAMQSYVLILQVPLFELGQVISEWQTGFASLERVVTILKLKKPGTESPVEMVDTQVSVEAANTTPADAKAEDAAIALEAKNLSYSYPDDNKNAVDNVSFSLKSGEKIGITGKIGSGKSTLIHLVSGLLAGYRGHIGLFGQPLTSLPRTKVTKDIVIVPQNSFLFAGTLRFNLCLDQDYDDEVLLDILDTVQFSSSLDAMPDGLDSMLGEWGINLSGGQKQRVALARALLRPSKVLLIDDALSAVDSETEHHILANLKSRFRHKTIIWAAHRKSTLVLCDRTFEMSDGQLGLAKVDQLVDSPPETLGNTLGDNSKGSESSKKNDGEGEAP